MNRVLETTTLQELVERQRQKEASRNGEMLGSEGAVRPEQPRDTQGWEQQTQVVYR